MTLDDAILLESYTKLKSFVDQEQASCIQKWINLHSLRIKSKPNKLRIEIVDDFVHPSRKKIMIDDQFIGQIETLIDISSGISKVQCEIK